MTYTYSTTSINWGTNYPPRGMAPGSSNYPPAQPTSIQGGLQPRVTKARELDRRGDGSGYRPFWDFDQEAIDASALHWQVTTSVDGEIAGLYIQAPYGYANDLLRSPKSKILGQIADEMEAQGHKNWADAVRKDQISGASWRSSACQAFGFSYNPAYSVDKTFLQGLSSWQPYEIGVIHPELMSKLSEDEIAKPPQPSEKAVFDIAATGGIVGAAAFTVMALATSAWLFLPAILCGAVGVVAKRLSKNAMKHGKSSKETIGPRPGYVLKTTSGWVVMLFDSSIHASPADLSHKALEELNTYLEQTMDPDSSVGIVKTYTSTDGKMTFFQSDRPLQAECELSPYKAEQYLSLYAKHQAPALKERVYSKNEPMIINGTMMLPGIQADYQRHTTATGFQGASEWSPEAAMQRAAARTKEMESQVLSALGRQPEQTKITGDTEKARFVQVVKALKRPETPADVKNQIRPKLDALHASIASLSSLPAEEAETTRRSIDAQLTEMESQLGAARSQKQSIANDLMASFQTIVGDAAPAQGKAQASPTTVPSPSPGGPSDGINPFLSKPSASAPASSTSGPVAPGAMPMPTPSGVPSTPVVDPNVDSASPDLQSTINDITSSRLKDDDIDLDDLFD